MGLKLSHVLGGVLELLGTNSASSRTITFPDKDGTVALSNLLHVQHREASTVAGGSTVTATRNIRPLNAEVTNTIAGASVDTVTGIITLPAGTYVAQANGACYRPNANKLLLYNIDDTSDAITGNSAFSSSGDSTFAIAFLDGSFTIASQKTFRLEHYTGSGFTTTGLGTPTSDGTVEIYANLQIRQIG